MPTDGATKIWNPKCWLNLMRFNFSPAGSKKILQPRRRWATRAWCIDFRPAGTSTSHGWQVDLVPAHRISRTVMLQGLRPQRLRIFSVWIETQRQVLEISTRRHTQRSSGSAFFLLVKSAKFQEYGPGRSTLHVSIIIPCWLVSSVVAQSPAIFPSRLAKYPRHKPFDGSSPRRIKDPRPNLCQTCWTSMARIPKALHSAHFLTHKSYKYPRKLRLCQGKHVSVGPINLPVPTTRSAAEAGFRDMVAGCIQSAALGFPGQFQPMATGFVQKSCTHKSMCKSSFSLLR